MSFLSRKSPSAAPEPSGPGREGSSAPSREPFIRSAPQSPSELLSRTQSRNPPLCRETGTLEGHPKTEARPSGSGEQLMVILGKAPSPVCAFSILPE